MSEALGYAESKQRAEDEGAIIIHTDTNLLLLDLDGPTAYNTYKRVIQDVNHYHSIEEKDQWDSKTAGHYHIRLRLSTELPFAERMVLQAVLGSDPKREMLSMIRHRLDPARPEHTLSMLFKPRHL